MKLAAVVAVVSMVAPTAGNFITKTAIGSWSLEVTTNPITDAKSAILVTMATDASPQIDSALELLCHPGRQPVIQIRANKQFNDIADIKITARFDRDQPRVFTATAYDDKFFFRPPLSGELVALMTEHAVLSMEYPPAASTATPGLIRFELRETGRAFEALLNACKGS